MSYHTAINPDLDDIEKSLIHPKVDTECKQITSQIKSTEQDHKEFIAFDINKINLGQSHRDLSARLMH